MNRINLPCLILLSGCLLSCALNKENTPRLTDAPGIYPADEPTNIESYFDSLQQNELAYICIHMPEDGDEVIVRNSITELQKYVEGRRKFYPVEEVNRALELLAFEQGYTFSHPGEDPNRGEIFFFRYLEQAARLCPDLSFIADATTPDGKVGILYFPEWSQINPLYSFLLYPRSEGGFNVLLIGEIGNEKIQKIYQLTDEQGRHYYLCSCNITSVYFRQFLYQITEDKAILLCSSEQPDSGIEKWTAPDTDYHIIFNPQKICWNYCYRKGDIYYSLPGTSTLFLQLDGEKSHFYVE